MRLVQPQAKTGGSVGSLLANPGQGLLAQFGGVGKAQGVGVDLQAQVAWGQALRGGQGGVCQVGHGFIPWAGRCAVHGQSSAVRRDVLKCL